MPPCGACARGAGWCHRRGRGARTLHSVTQSILVHLRVACSAERDAPPHGRPAVVSASGGRRDWRSPSPADEFRRGRYSRDSGDVRRDGRDGRDKRGGGYEGRSSGGDMRSDGWRREERQQHTGGGGGNRDRHERHGSSDWSPSSRGDGARYRDDDRWRDGTRCCCCCCCCCLRLCVPRPLFCLAGCVP
jgi:hypothetical protein